MTPLLIGRVTAAVHLPEPDDGIAVRVDGLLRAATGDRLDTALRATTLPDGIWCVRRVDAPVRLDLARTDAALADTWAAAMTTAVVRAMAAGGPHVVRYRCPADAVHDLVHGLMAGLQERTWAWRAAGVLEPADPDPGTQPGAALLAVAARQPDAALGAVVAAAVAVGLAPLHRALGAGGWAALAALVAGMGTPVAPEREETSAVGEEAALLADRLVAASSFAVAARRSRLRPDAMTRAAWARLVVAEVDATAVRRASAPAVLARIADALAVRTDPPARMAPPSPAAVAGPVAGSLRAGPAAGTAVAEAAPAGRQATSPPPSPPSAVSEHRRADHIELAETDPAFPTAWAGLLFLLVTADRAGVPDGIVDDPRFAARPLSWVLRHTAEALGVPATDPVVAAFAGADPGRPEPWDPATPAEAAGVAELADRWSGATVAALHPDGRDLDGRDPLEVVLHRPGVLRWLPGWVELEMPLDTVDLDVRRAGLDLDPGWVPWLGVVVRYRYG